MLVGPASFLALELGLGVLDGIGRFGVRGDRLACGRLDAAAAASAAAANAAATSRTAAATEAAAAVANPSWSFASLWML